MSDRAKAFGIDKSDLLWLADSEEKNSEHPSIKALFAKPRLKALFLSTLRDLLPSLKGAIAT